mgnify:CR=1 FL=1
MHGTRQPARQGGEQGAEQADQQDAGHQFRVGEAVSRIEDEIAEPGADAEHFARHQHDPDDADGESDASQDMAEMPGRMMRNSVSVRVALRLRPSCSQRGSSWRTPAAVFSMIGHTAAKASRK